MKNDILFITAFRDINRGNWNHIPRKTDNYCDSFYKFASKMKYNIIVFVNDEIKQFLLNKYQFGKHITFLNLDSIETFYHKYILFSNRFKLFNIE